VWQNFPYISILTIVTSYSPRFGCTVQWRRSKKVNFHLYSSLGGVRTTRSAKGRLAGLAGDLERSAPGRWLITEHRTGLLGHGCHSTLHMPAYPAYAQYANHFRFSAIPFWGCTRMLAKPATAALHNWIIAIFCSPSPSSAKSCLNLKPQTNYFNNYFIAKLRVQSLGDYFPFWWWSFKEDYNEIK